MRWWGLLLVAGCYDPAPVPACATTNSCVDASVDAEIDGSPFVDTDQDGIFDATDNCVTAKNPMQENHDGDTRGDVCDPCPHLAGPMFDADDDDDGLGNGCDPNRALPVDSFIAFYGFYPNQSLTGWNANGWTLTGGAMHYPNNNTAGILEPPETAEDVFVMTAIRGISQAGGSVDHHVGVAARRAGGAYHACRAHVPTGGAKAFQHETFDGASGYDLQTGSVWNGVLLNDTNILRYSLFGARVDCEVFTIAAGEKGTLTDLQTDIRPGKLGILAGIISVDVDYIYIARPGG